MKLSILLVLLLPLSAIAQTPAGDMPDMGDVFIQKFDINKDGTVDVAEFRQPSEKQFAIMDTNKDGVVDADEARAYSRMMMQRMQQMQQQMRNIQRQQMPAPR